MEEVVFAVAVEVGEIRAFGEWACSGRGVAVGVVRDWLNGVWEGRCSGWRGERTWVMGLMLMLMWMLGGFGCCRCGCDSIS